MKKAALLVEDRETGWLFTDTDNADPDAVVMDVEIADDVPATELDNENIALWLHDDSGDKLRVVLYESYDFSTAGDDGWHPIPSPILVENVAEYERMRAE